MGNGTLLLGCYGLFQGIPSCAGFCQSVSETSIDYTLYDTDEDKSCSQLFNQQWQGTQNPLCTSSTGSRSDPGKLEGEQGKEIGSINPIVMFPLAWYLLIIFDVS